LRIFNAIATAVVVTSLFIWASRASPPRALPITEGPVVLHIKGGLLEVSTIHAAEQFEAITKERLLGLPTGKCCASIRMSSSR
jgi:hypothetical protein